MQEKYCRSANKFPKIDVAKRGVQLKWAWEEAEVRARQSKRYQRVVGGWLLTGMRRCNVVFEKGHIKNERLRCKDMLNWMCVPPVSLRRVRYCRNYSHRHRGNVLMNNIVGSTPQGLISNLHFWHLFICISIRYIRMLTHIFTYVHIFILTYLDT